jgi:hypothetical protein
MFEVSEYSAGILLNDDSLIIKMQKKVEEKEAQLVLNMLPAWIFGRIV